jgi:hypothetical protein
MEQSYKSQIGQNNYLLFFKLDSVGGFGFYIYFIVSVLIFNFITLYLFIFVA